MKDTSKLTGGISSVYCANCGVEITYKKKFVDERGIDFCMNCAPDLPEAIKSDCRKKPIHKCKESK